MRTTSARPKRSVEYIVPVDRSYQRNRINVFVAWTLGAGAGTIGASLYVFSLGSVVLSYIPTFLKGYVAIGGCGIGIVLILVGIWAILDSTY